MDIETLTELYWEQQKSGNPESPESFAARYPGQQTELLAVLPALAALETMTPAAPPLLPPNRLGDFQLHEPIGSGGMGNVYRATQLSLQRDVAVKILSSPLAMDEKARQRFMNEARIIAGLHHPNIVNVYGAGYEQGWCFYVMELIDGQALNCDAFSHDPEKLQKITGIANTSLKADDAKDTLTVTWATGDCSGDCSTPDVNVRNSSISVQAGFGRGSWGKNGGAFAIYSEKLNYRLLDRFACWTVLPGTAGKMETVRQWNLNRC